MKLALDIDDTLAEFVEKMKERFLGDCADETSPILKQMFPMREREIEDLIRSAEFHRSLDVVPGAVPAVWRLLEDGHEVHYVTSRRKELLFATTAWLREKGFPYHKNRLHVVGRDKMAKSSQYRALGVALVVDDYPQALGEAALAGAEPIAFDRPWNRDGTWKRIRTWEEIHALVG